jgi:hypothetical protein
MQVWKDDWLLQWERYQCRRPGIDYEESIPPAYVAWRAGTIKRVDELARQAENRFLGALKGLQIRALECTKNTPPPVNTARMVTILPTQEVCTSALWVSFSSHDIPCREFLVFFQNKFSRF